MTERVIILWRNFENMAKKLKLQSQDPKKHIILTFLEIFTKKYGFYGPV